MSEPALKCENSAIFKPNYAKNCLLLLKWPILFVWLKGKSRFSRFPPKNVLKHQLQLCIGSFGVSPT